jgi:hypothetical protein
MGFTGFCAYFLIFQVTFFLFANGAKHERKLLTTLWEQGWEEILEE